MTDPHILEPGTAPTPFTADEIRSGCPPGRSVTTLVWGRDEGPYLLVTRFVECDADGTVQAARRWSLQGEPLSEVESRSSTWLSLQRHASFPAAATTITEETIDVPFGTFHCLRYTVTGDQVATFWFARDLPGMPIRVRTEADGVLLGTMTMVANS